MSTSHSRTKKRRQDILKFTADLWAVHGRTGSGPLGKVTVVDVASYMLDTMLDSWEHQLESIGGIPKTAALRKKQLAKLTELYEKTQRRDALAAARKQAKHEGSLH